MCLGVPGRIVSLREEEGLAMGTVDVGGVLAEVCMAYVDGEVAVGDHVIVHVGFALCRLDEEEAQATLEALRAIGALEEWA